MGADVETSTMQKKFTIIITTLFSFIILVSVSHAGDDSSMASNKAQRIKLFSITSVAMAKPGISPSNEMTIMNRQKKSEASNYLSTNDDSIFEVSNTYLTFISNCCNSLIKHITKPVSNWTNNTSLSSTNKKIVTSTINLSATLIDKELVNYIITNDKIDTYQVAANFVNVFIGSVLSNLLSDKIEINIHRVHGQTISLFSYKM
jgi:hypothetical protein